MVDLIIPDDVFYHKKLSDGAKLCFAEIYKLTKDKPISLTKPVRPIYFMNKLNKSRRSVGYYLSELQEQKIIRKHKTPKGLIIYDTRYVPDGV